MNNETRNICVTALNIMDGLDHNRHWEALQPAWDGEGMGFLEFTMWITDIAAMVDGKLQVHEEQDFPGVFDYEVSHELGRLILKHVVEWGVLPDMETLTTWSDELIDAFFKQGEKA